MTLTYENATPVLRVTDYAKSKAFYMDVLGFHLVQEAGEPDPGFGIFRAGSAQIFLHAWDGPEAAWDGWRGYFYAADMDGLTAHLTAKGQAFKGPETTWYGMEEVEVTDLDGNVLCFGRDAG